MLYAQVEHVSGKITDYDTGLPLSNAMVSCNNLTAVSDTDGHFSLTCTSTKSALQISLLGYESRSIMAGNNTLNIALKRKYNTLTEVVVKERKLSIDSLLLKAADNVPRNYLASNNALKGLLRILLYKDEDTVLHVEKPVFLDGLHERWFHFGIFCRQSDTAVVYKNSLTKNLQRSYIYEDDHILRDNFMSVLRNYAYKKDCKIVVSDYQEQGVKFYDLVFIDTNAHEKYSPLMRAFGYGKKMNSMKDDRLIELSELCINATNFAVSFYNVLIIEASDAKKKSFVQLNSKAAIESWVEEQMAAKSKYSQNKAVFNANANGKWLLKSIYNFDNLLHISMRDVNATENYTYIQSYSDLAATSNLPDDARSIYINTFSAKLIRK